MNSLGKRGGHMMLHSSYSRTVPRVSTRREWHPSISACFLLFAFTDIFECT